MTDAPLHFTWNGEAMIPATSYQAKLADRHFVIGEHYALVEHKERSGNSHRAYFAELHELFLSLPEEFAMRFPTEDHLRKHALIMTGYRDVQEYACGSKAEALRLAAVIRSLDTYCVTVVQGATVQRLTAKSQNMRSMTRKEFQASKDAVLEHIADMIGVKREQAA